MTIQFIRPSNNQILERERIGGVDGDDQIELGATRNKNEWLERNKAMRCETTGIDGRRH